MGVEVRLPKYTVQELLQQGANHQPDIEEDMEEEDVEESVEDLKEDKEDSDSDPERLTIVMDRPVDTAEDAANNNGPSVRGRKLRKKKN